MTKPETFRIPRQLGEIATPAGCALVVYDMQAGILSQLPHGREILGKVLEVLEIARGRDQLFDDALFARVERLEGERHLDRFESGEPLFDGQGGGENHGVNHRPAIVTREILRPAKRGEGARRADEGRFFTS